MIEKIAWVTDTSAYLNDGFVEKLNIHVLSINVIFEDGSFREKVELTLTEFYEKMRTAKALPTTSQPLFGDMVNLYKQLKAKGYSCAIAVHPTSLLSGTYAGSIAAAKQADFPLYAIDSKIISYPMRKMLETGHALAAQGVKAKDIAQVLEEMADRVELSGIPANLTQLYKSGRVPGIVALLGNFLKLKVIVSFQNGRVVLKDKVRTYKRAKEYVTELLRKELNHSTLTEVAIVHSHNDRDAEHWKAELQAEFPFIQFIILPLSASISVHTGEGTTGLSWVRGG
ncbi:fatty acid-binding protein DegV [Lysinibacillus contaminans]|uniref:Fatty acid-binding protein DegV n=1 Tax=Lysinibacillus contaminans TaxID=1293441 RepID=A0ABR5JYT2_9BACI|nr:DegV family protein [Lysinibacillus contaminans]KOS67817.1 fatty acid-binding protein DegV [Lysinibacillus contaminans]